MYEYVCICMHMYVFICMSRGVARGLTAPATASTLCLRERETSIRSPPRDRTHTHTHQPLRAAGPGSRATCSLLACLGTKAATARCVNPCLADLLGKGFLLYPSRTVQTNARSGGEA